MVSGQWLVVSGQWLVVSGQAPKRSLRKREAADLRLASVLPIIFWKISYCIVRDFIVKGGTCLCYLIELLNTATKVCFFLVLSKYMS